MQKRYIIRRFFLKVKIIKVHPLKISRAEKAFRRIEFISDSGEWLKTDIVPAYRNFKIWKPIIGLFESGASVFLEGIDLRNPGEVDGDSLVRMSSPFEVMKRTIKEEKKKIIQDSLL